MTRVFYTINLRISGRWHEVQDTYFNSLGYLCPVNGEHESYEACMRAVRLTNRQINGRQYDYWDRPFAAEDVQVLRHIVTTEVVESGAA